jgi:hypothetical protein
MPLNSDQVPRCQAKFGLTYHVSYAQCCEQMVGFEGKHVLEVGGSLPQEFVSDYLRARAWTALEAPAYEAELQTAGGSVHTGSDIKNPAVGAITERGYGPMRPDHYRLLWANIEDLPESYYGHYDLIFSIAAFEHVDSAILVAQRVVPEAKIGWLDITSESFAVSGKYEVVFCAEVLEHLVNPSLAIKNLLTLVQSPGLLVVTVPDGRRDTFIGHIHFWSPESWEQFIYQNIDSQRFFVEIGLLDQMVTNYDVIKAKSIYESQ